MCWTAWFKHCYALHLWYLTSTYDVTHLFYDLYHFPAAFFHITFTVITCLGFVRLKYQACFDRPLPTISYSWPYITEGTSDLNVSPLMSHTVDVRAFKSPAIKHEQVMKQQKKKHSGLCFQHAAGLKVWWANMWGKDYFFLCLSWSFNQAGGPERPTSD